jgi:hypothetical protein
MTDRERKRIRRDERPDNPPKMRLTERDKWIVEAVYQYRVLMQRQIEQLFFGHKTSAQRRLSLLYQHGYLERQFLPVRGGIMNSPILYLLDKRGAELLAAEFGHNDIRWKRENNQVGQEFLEHALAINEVRIAVTLACQKLGYTLLTWKGESDLKGDYDRVKLGSLLSKRTSVSVIPDSQFVVDTPRQSEKTKAYFFLELDRGTMTTKRFRGKVEAYIEYVNSGGYERRYGTRSLRILTVAPSRARLASLKQVTEDVGGKNRFWFAVQSDLSANTIFDEAVWSVAGSREAARLIEL